MGQSLTPLVNGKSYEWADITINILGVPFAGVTAIEYEDKQEMKDIMGAGNRPVSRSYGNYSASAKVTLLMEEIENIQKVAPGGVLQRIPEFDITVAYVDSALTPVKHTIKNCRFRNNARKVKQGDSSITCDMDLIVSHILFA